MGKMNVDDALRDFGGYRRWSIFLFILLSASTFMGSSLQGLSLVFTAWQPPHHCKVNESTSLNTTIPLVQVKEELKLAQCLMYNSSTYNDTIPCTDGWTFDNEGYNTIVTDWDLVCDKNYQAELAYTLYEMGALISDLLLANQIDRLGRRLVHIMSQGVIIVIGIATAFSTGYWMFVVLRIFLAMSVTLSANSGLTLIMELFDSSKRTFVGIANEYVWITLYLLLAALAYPIYSWRTLQIVLSSLSAIWIIYIWILPESPTWLATNHRKKELDEVLQSLARWNGVKVGKSFCIEDRRYSRRKSFFVDVKDIKKAQVPIIEVIRNPRLRLHVVICSFIWLINMLVYYGLILASYTLKGNRFLNYCIMGLVEIPAVTVPLLLADRIGRRFCLIFFHVIGGLCYLVVMFIPEKTESGQSLAYLSITFVMLTKFGITCSFNVLLLYARELFPTNLRSTSAGICLIFGRFGSILAPYVGYLKKTSLYWLPNIVLSVLSICAGLSTLLLPETVGYPLPQTMKDLEGMIEARRNQPCCSCKKPGTSETLEETNTTDK